MWCSITILWVQCSPRNIQGFQKYFGTKRTLTVLKEKCFHGHIWNNLYSMICMIKVLLVTIAADNPVLKSFVHWIPIWRVHFFLQYLCIWINSDDCHHSKFSILLQKMISVFLDSRQIEFIYLEKQGDLTMISFSPYACLFVSP